MRLKAVFLLGTLKRRRAGGDFSHTETLCELVIEGLRSHNVASEIVRLVEYEIKPGIKSNMGKGDEWPGILKKVLASDIIVFATPIWWGIQSSLIQRVIERLDELHNELWRSVDDGPEPRVLCATPQAEQHPGTVRLGLANQMLAAVGARPTLDLPALEDWMRPIRTLGLVTALTLVAFGGRLPAQQPTAPPAAPGKTGTAEISGVLLDSLNGRFLRGAEVVIEGSTAVLYSDSTGRFSITGLPPGTYQVGVFHPLLDTLAISLGTKPFHVGPDSVSVVILSVPSAATIIQRACPPPRDGQPNSAVIGYVRDPETLQPVAGAEVSMAWTLIEVSKQVGIRHTPHVVRDTADAWGAFQICGLPSPMDATLQARTRTTATSEIPVSLGDTRSALYMRTLLLSLADSGATARKATVSGRVVLEGSSPKAGSRVELVGTDVVGLTNENGEFTMTNLPSGSQVLLARHLGYGAATAPVELNSREPQKVTITLPKFVAVMDPVLVTARRTAALDRVGFNQRRRSGVGYYIGPDQLRKVNAFRLSDILRRVPGLRVSYSGGHNEEVISSSRGGSLSSQGCIQYYVDDMPWMAAWPGDINGFVNPSEVVAVEVYQGPTAPPQYIRGMSSCTTIVLWTRFKIREGRER